MYTESCSLFLLEVSEKKVQCLGINARRENVMVRQGRTSSTCECRMQPWPWGAGTTLCRKVHLSVPACPKLWVLQLHECQPSSIRHHRTFSCRVTHSFPRLPQKMHALSAYRTTHHSRSRQWLGHEATDAFLWSPVSRLYLPELLPQS